MMNYNSLISKRKGITPIIATVLLLGITVAIGLTVYTQAQGMIGNTDTSSIDRVQNTDLALSPVYNNNGEMSLQVRNRGDRAINVTKYTIQYGPPNWDPVTYQTIESQTEWNTSEGNKCFTSEMAANADNMDNDILEPGEQAGCDTGVEFPDALQSVEIRVVADNFDYSATTICSADSASAKSCS